MNYVSFFIGHKKRDAPFAENRLTREIVFSWNLFFEEGTFLITSDAIFIRDILGSCSFITSFYPKNIFNELGKLSQKRL